MEGFNAPTIDWYALSPVLVTLGGAVVVLLVALFLPIGARRPFSAAVAAVCFVAAAGLAVALFVADDTGTGIVADAIRRDRLADFAQVLVMVVGLLTVLVS
jgi:NADH-quinone oxidoreductase subunit N